MSRGRPWLRAGLAAGTLAFVVWRLGTGPFVAGVRAVDGGALAVAATVGIVTTVCCAWRWTAVARGLGVPVPMSSAVAAYYRSVFLNLSLPGGVAGDVHRGVRHGRAVHDVGRALRAVVWERVAGQVVQAVLTVVVLLLLPSPARAAVPYAAAALAVLALALVVAARSRLRAVAVDMRRALLRGRALPVVVLASVVVVLGHAVTFLVAARTAGVDASASRLLPLALLALLGMVLPSVAGWGPREGVTAWVFSAAGLGAGRGAATAVTYGVLALVASLPGALVLLADWAARPSRALVYGRSR